MIATHTSARRRRGQAPRAKKRAAAESQSLLDVVDCLLDRGLALDSEIVLGLADIDLVYLRVGALVAAADRVFRPARSSGRPARTRHEAIARTPRSGQPVRPPAGTLITATPSPALERTQMTASSPDDTSRSIMRLALTVVEFIRQLLERQAVRRVRERTLDADEIERLGTALMRLEATVRDLAERHGLAMSDLNLDLGPLGHLR